MKQFRKGDIVTIECVVEYLACTELRIRPIEGNASIYVRPDWVKNVRQVIEVDDVIKNIDRPGAPEGRVLSVRDDLVWVQANSGHFVTWYTKDCRRVEQLEEGIAA